MEMQIHGPTDFISLGNIKARVEVEKVPIICWECGNPWWYNMGKPRDVCPHCGMFNHRTNLQYNRNIGRRIC